MMHMQKIRDIAKKVNVVPGTMEKDELADLMQREPGLRQDWNEKYGDRMQKLVFIGQHLDKDEITRQLDSILLD